MIDSSVCSGSLSVKSVARGSCWVMRGSSMSNNESFKLSLCRNSFTSFSMTYVSSVCRGSLNSKSSKEMNIYRKGKKNVFEKKKLLNSKFQYFFKKIAFILNFKSVVESLIKI